MTSPGAATGVDVGSVIADTYTIEALVGRGGMGSVFRASHNRLPGKQVAIKLLHAGVTDDEVIARFRREALIATQLDHPNIVAVHDFNVTAQGVPYLVLELLHGETLAHRLARGPLTLAQLRPLVRQIGSALAAAHGAGIVHRDLKPQNIFLVPRDGDGDGGGGELVKVLDFGISKIRGSQTVQTQEHALLGTPQYMSPEQADGRHDEVDERTDVFALGAIVYEMLSGAPAFEGANIPEVMFKVVYKDPPPLAARVPGLAPEIAELVGRALAKQASARVPTIAAFVEELTGQPLTLPPRARTPTASRASAAYAATVGSGDHQGAIAAVDPMDATVASHDGHGRVPPAAVSATAPTTSPTTAPVAAPSSTPAPRPRSLGLIAGIAAASMAVAALVMYVVMHDRGEPAPDPVPVATVPIATVPVPVIVADAPPDAPPAAPPDAPPAIAAAPPVDAPSPPRPVPPAPRPLDFDNDGDPAVNARLRDAMAAFAAGDYTRATHLANLAADHATSSRQTAQAAAIAGAAACKGNNDQGALGTGLRQIGKHARWAAFLRRACKHLNLGR